MKILFLDDCNGHEINNPYANLVEVFEDISKEAMKDLECKQLGVCRSGGSWKEIMSDGNIKYNHMSHGRESDYADNEYDLKYKVISGNY